MDIVLLAVAKIQYSFVWFLPLIMAGLSLASGAAKYKAAQSQAEVLEDEQKRMGQRTSDSDVRDLVSLSKAQLNARSPGAVQAEQNIKQQQANTLAAVNRNSLDSSQALGLAGALQGRSNEALAGLSTAEDQYRRGQVGQLVQSIGMKQADDDRVWEDRFRQYQIRSSILGTKLQNQMGAMDSTINGLASAGAMYAGGGNDFGGQANGLGTWSGPYGSMFNQVRPGATITGV